MFTFRPIRQKELELHQKFRYHIFNKAGYLPSSPQELDEDGYDCASDHFFAFHEEKIIGCARLTYLGQHEQTYTDQFWEPVDFGVKRELIAEINRYGIHPDYRQLRNSLLIGYYLTKLMCQTAEDKGIRVLVTGIHHDFYRSMRLQKKIPYTRVGVSPKEYHGEYSKYLEENTEEMVLLKMDLSEYFDLNPKSES